MQGEVCSVLAVDDDERILATYKRSFDRTWSLHCASTIEEAWSLSRERRFDAAILDLHMGTSSSIPLLRSLRASSPDLRIVVVSGYLTTESTVIAVRSGADVVVEKPIRPHEILRRLFEESNGDIDLRDTPTLEEAVESHIARVFLDCAGNVSETARRLGICRSSLQRRLRRSPVKRLS